MSSDGSQAFVLYLFVTFFLIWNIVVFCDITAFKIIRVFVLFLNRAAAPECQKA